MVIPPTPPGQDLREKAEARAIASQDEASAEYNRRVASFPRDLLGARLQASLQEHEARKTSQPRPTKRPPREPLLERNIIKVRRVMSYCPHLHRGH